MHDEAQSTLRFRFVLGLTMILLLGVLAVQGQKNDLRQVLMSDVLLLNVYVSSSCQLALFGYPD